MKKTRIAFIVNNFDVTSGVTTYILTLVRNLEENYELYLITSPGSAIKLLNKYRIKYFLIESLNFNNRSLFNYIISIIKVGIVIIRNKIDLVHSNDYYTANIVKATKFFKNIPNVRTVHYWLFENSKLDKLAGDYLIGVNHHLFDIVSKSGLKYKTEIIFNGLDFTDYYDYEKAYSRLKISILVASRLVLEKGVQNVIKAISILPEAYKEKIELRIAGKGEYEDNLINLSISLQVNVNFLGEVLDISQEYKRADIFIFSSLNDWFGYTNIEAAKHGCFVITSNFDGIEYIFEDNIDGFIYDKNSDTDLSNKIIQAFELGEKRKVYIKNFQRKCMTEFNSIKMVSKTIEVYNKCLKNHS